jgi:hypothetical protein
MTDFATACPVAALRAWIEAAGIVEGAVFRRINKRASTATSGKASYTETQPLPKTS